MFALENSIAVTVASQDSAKLAPGFLLLQDRVEDHLELSLMIIVTLLIVDT